jgi:predicted permease
VAQEFYILLESLKRTGSIYLGVLLGFLWMKTPLEKYRKQFVKTTINLLTPLIILISLLRIEIDNDWVFPVLAAILVTLCGITIPRILAKIHHADKPEPAEICTASFSNALNFPFPVIFAMAPDSLGTAGIFLVVAIILRNTVGLWISGVGLSKGALKEILSFPPIWGIIIGLFLRFSTNTGSGEWINSQFVQVFFELGIFATVMTIGFSIRKPKLEYKFSIYRVAMTRYVASGVLALLLVYSFSLSEFIAIPIIVQMIAPPAVYNGLYAERFNLNTELTSQVIVSLTLIALLILPLELLALQLMF